MQLSSNKILKEVFDNKLLQAQILDANTQDQMYERGVDAEGDPLGEYGAYTGFYKTFIAGGLGNDTRSDHITLKDTGEFYRSFKLKNYKDGFIIYANTIKISKGKSYISKITGKRVTPTFRDDLLDRWPDIIGLDEKNRSELKEEIKPDIIRGINKSLRG